MKRILEIAVAIATILGVIISLAAWLSPFNPTGNSPVAPIATESQAIPLVTASVSSPTPANENKAVVITASANNSVTTTIPFPVCLLTGIWKARAPIDDEEITIQWNNLDKQIENQLGTAAARISVNRLL